MLVNLWLMEVESTSSCGFHSSAFCQIIHKICYQEKNKKSYDEDEGFSLFWLEGFLPGWNLKYLSGSHDKSWLTFLFTFL